MAALAIGLLGSSGGALAQVLEDLSPASIQQQVRPGDAVRATVQDGRTFELTVVAVEQETLTGTTAENRRFRIRYSALASLEITGRAAAGAPDVVTVAAPQSGDDIRTWLGLNAGVVSGEVDVPCSDPSSRGCSEGGLFTSFGLNLTVAGAIAARLRAVHANEDTDQQPLELAALIGPRIGQDFYLLVGGSNVSHPDDDYEGDADGVAWELLYAPRSLSGAGVEISLHGARGDDLSYSGLSVGARFGKLR